jgi:serine/threonine protein kinase
VSRLSLRRKGPRGARADAPPPTPVPAHILAMHSVDWGAVRSTSAVAAAAAVAAADVVVVSAEAAEAEAAEAAESDGSTDTNMSSSGVGSDEMIHLAAPSGVPAADAAAVAAAAAAAAAAPVPGLGLPGLTLSFMESPTKRKRLSSDERAVLNEFWECSSCSSSERGDNERMSEVEGFDSSSSDDSDSDNEDDSRTHQSDLLSKAQCKQFTLHETIGKGAFGHVKRATYKTKTYAAKVLTWEEGNEDKAKEFVSEMRNLKELTHKHIVRYVGSDLDMVIKRLIIYTEWMPSGSLKDQMDECRGNGKMMSDASVCNYAWQIAGGLAYLHKNNVAHLDLKPANIVRDQDGVVKLTDFGTSRKLIESHSFHDDRKRGTVCFMAPEIFWNGACMESDIWSYGCTVLNLAVGQLPWHETGIMDEIVLGVHIASTGSEAAVPAVDKVRSESLRKLVSRCLQRDRSKRPKIYSVHTRLGFQVCGTSPIKSPMRSKSRSCSHLLAAAAEEEAVVAPLSPSNHGSSPQRARSRRHRGPGGENFF